MEDFLPEGMASVHDLIKTCRKVQYDVACLRTENLVLKKQVEILLKEKQEFQEWKNNMKTRGML